MLSEATLAAVVGFHLQNGQSTTFMHCTYVCIIRCPLWVCEFLPGSVLRDKL